MKALAHRWTAVEVEALDARLTSMLRGIGRPHDPEHRRDYLEVCEGLPARWVLDAIDRVRRQPRPFCSPGELRQAAIEPMPTAVRASRCQDCGADPCRCDAVPPPPEAVAALARLGIKL